MPWKKLLPWATGQYDDALCQKLEFALEEHRDYHALLDRPSPHWPLEDAERKRLAEKVTPLGKLWAEVMTIVLISQTNLQFRSQRLSAQARLATFGLEAVETM